ncbi:MAG TPA: hypothetical protein VI895_12740 [Bdellovibrionota bacterium]|nr:hypothetical protein [Bdellovibrionota bacterium]
MSTLEPAWRRCASCKKRIGFDQRYWACSVSTCNRSRTGVVFCSVTCWDQHVPILRHRDAYAEEARSPTKKEWENMLNEQKTTDETTDGETSVESGTPQQEQEVLVVASKVKAYIRRQADMNTSADVMKSLSGKIRKLCDDAIGRAKESGRKTVLDRDIL